MPLSKPVRWIIYGAVGLTALTLILLAVLALVKIPINLKSQKALVEEITSSAIGRKVSIDKQIQVTTSLWPVFTIEGLRIGNPKNFKSGDFARMESARVQVGVIPLLLGKVHVKDFSTKGLHIFLKVDEKGAVNWTFNQSSSNVVKITDKDGLTLQQDSIQFSSDTLVVDKINLNRISVSYLEPDMADPFKLNIDQCTGSALVGKPLQLSLEGSFLKEPFTTALKAASLQELIEQNKSWVEIETNIANARIKLNGSIDISRMLHTLRLSVSVKGKRLESFNRMLKLDLPPLPSYGAKATLSLLKDKIELSGLKIRVGDSELVGKFTGINTGSRSKIDIDLKSSLIQINDFDFDDWSPIKESSNKSEPSEVSDVKNEEDKEKMSARTPNGSEVAEATLELLSPEFLKNFDARMTVSAEKVLSGADQLGNGHLIWKLKDGLISIDPLDLNVPGGSFSFAMSLKPGLKSSKAALQAKIKNFDFGILARRADPKTNMGGTFNLDVDLNSSAKNFKELLANGNGYVDFSAHPENLRAGIIDLWAINLIAGIAARSDKNQSQIECLVGRWSMKDGFLKPDAFVIDTSRMRICGKGWVNFKKEEVDLKVAPTPKKPEFFSLATPLGVHGKFADFDLGIVPGGVVATTIKFIFSPIHVPVRRLAG
jgi:uncharacterized protein involved in outer membrane biogenesis